MTGHYGVAGDFPPPPWVPNIEPELEDVARWLQSMTPEQLVAALKHQRSTWRQQSECFERNHEGRIDDFGRQMDTVHTDLVAIMSALGIGDHARPYSSHEVIHREVIPAIWRLTRATGDESPKPRSEAPS